MSGDRSFAREIRVFLSSTFKDMEEERRYLLAQVFPVFRLECLERLVTFTEIDLRWGITEEEAKNGRTVEICLEEIERCRGIKPPPFFIGFLGERYGWIPKEEDLEHYWKLHSASPYATLIKNALEKDISVTELEMQEALLDKGRQEDALRGRVFLRARTLTDVLARQSGATSEDLRFYDPAGSRLEALKARLRASPFMGLDGYESLEAFGDAVLAFLRQQLDVHFPPDELPDEFAQQTQLHAFYAQSRLQAYVPLQEAEAEIRTLIQQASAGGETRKLHIKAPSGWGKSAFLARLQNDIVQNGAALVFAHYTGADGDLTLTGWRDRLLHFMSVTGHLVSKIPDSDQERWNILPVLLAEMVKGSGQRLILLLDALNQFTEQNEALDYLRDIKLPEDVVLVMTSTPEINIPQALIFNLPALDEPKRREAIKAFLTAYRKNLSAELILELSKAESCENPLFLRLVLEELRVHAQHETLEVKAKKLLTYPDAGALFLHILHVMDHEDFADTRHPDMALRAARLMAVSWRGLYYKDLARILAEKDDPLNPDNQQPQLPDFFLAPLLARLLPFCLYDEGRLTLTHAILRQGLMRDAAIVVAVRKDLVSCFKGRLDAVAVAESVFQLRQLEDRRAVVDMLGVPDASFAFWRAYPILLRSVLTWLGAGDAKAPPEIEKLAIMWREAIQSLTTIPGDANSLVSWLQEQSYLFLGVALGESCRDWYEVHDITSPLILNALGVLYIEQGRYDDAEKAIKKTLEIKRQSLLAEHPATAVDLNNLASIYLKQGRYVEAESLYRQALEIYRQSLPAGHGDIATCLNNLATLRKNLENYSEAEQLYRQALEIYRQSLPAGHPDIAAGLNNLASTCQALGSYGEAEGLYKQGLEIFRRSLPAKHPNIAKALGNLAGLYYVLGRYSEAEPLYKQALEIDLQSLPAGHPEIAKALGNLAGFYQALGRYSEAELLYKQALEIDRRSLVVGHPEIAARLDNLAELYQALGNYAEAESLFKNALEIRRRSLPAGHLDIARSLNNLASIYTQQEHYSQAESLFQETLKIYNQSFPAGHPDIARTLNNLACLYQEQQNFTDAEFSFKKALEIYRKFLPSLHPDIAKTLSSLAGLYREIGDISKAVPLFEEALNIRRKSLPAGHLNIASSLNNLASLYKKQGHYNEAKVYLEEALKIRCQSQPAGHPDITATLSNLADLCARQGNYGEAVNLYKEALKDSRHFLPARHENIAAILSDFVSLYMQHRCYNQAESLLKEALEIDRQSLPAGHPAIATSINKLLVVYMEQEKYIEAEALLKKELNIYRNILPEDNQLRAYFENVLVAIHQEMAMKTGPDHITGLPSQGN